MDIESISCSDGATICLQRSKNVLHLFNDYKCKRIFYIKETGSPFKKIRILGGKLDTFANPDLKWIQDLGREPITIVGLTENNLTAVPITKDEVLLKVIDQAQVQTNVFVERGKNSAYERVQRLGEVDNLGDMINYGYGFFNVIDKEN